MGSINTKSKITCQKPTREQAGCKKVPDVDSLSAMTYAELAGLKPVKVHVNEKYLYYFGLSLSNGQKQVTHSEADRAYALPDNITKIDIFFYMNEQFVHSMVFRGDTELAIGCTAEDDRLMVRGNAPEWTKGRKDTFNVPKGERLLGCEMFHDKNGHL